MTELTPPAISSTSTTRSTTPSSRHKLLIVGSVVGLIALSVWFLNFFLVERPVSKELATDVRNSEYSLKAHFRYYADISTLVLDLSDVEQVAPADLFRGLFQSSKALHDSRRQFDRVVLARSGKPVFVMEGDDFFSIGSEYGAGQNPVYLIRTLPEKLRRPDGMAAFGTWEGGWLGVLAKQMDDANEAARQWAGGS